MAHDCEKSNGVSGHALRLDVIFLILVFLHSKKILAWEGLLICIDSWTEASSLESCDVFLAHM